MRKSILVLFLVLTITAFVSAQNTGITSVFNDSSVGLFENELDTAVNVGPDFNTLNRSYLFTGLANLEGARAWDDQTFDNPGTWPGTPIWCGFYIAGEHPWSVFTGFSASDSVNNEADTTAYTTTPSVVGTTTYQWNNIVKDTDYTANTLFNDLYFKGQFLDMWGDINMGAYFGLNISHTVPASPPGFQGSNYKETEKVYYDSTPGAAPTPLLDYTRTATETAKAVSMIFSLAMPVYMESDGIGHEANLTTDLTLTDTSTTFVETYSGTPDTAIGTVTNTEVSETVDKTTTFGISGDYKQTLPRLWGKNADNRFVVGGSAGYSTDIPVYSDVLTTQDVTYAGGGAAGVTAVRANNSTTQSFGNSLILNFMVNAGHSFFYQLGTMVSFAMSPEFALGFDLSNDATIKSDVSVVKTDGNADGDFADAADTITTTTTTYTNTDSATGNYNSTIDITTTLELPIAVTIAPEKWPFFITLGSKPQVTLVNTTRSTKTAVNSVKTVAVDGTGAASGTDSTVNAGTSNESSVTDSTISVTATHNIGMTMPLGESVKLDVNLDMSGDLGIDTANIFDFKNLVIQVIIALP